MLTPAIESLTMVDSFIIYACKTQYYQAIDESNHSLLFYFIGIYLRAGGSSGQSSSEARATLPQCLLGNIYPHSEGI